MNELFSDREAADMIESMQPELADAIRDLVLAGQMPNDITRSVKGTAGGELIRSLINQAAHHYTTLNGPIADDDGIVTRGGVTYRYNVIDNHHGVARWQCREYVTDRMPSYRMASVAIRQWIAAQA